MKLYSKNNTKNSYNFLGILPNKLPLKPALLNNFRPGRKGANTLAFVPSFTDNKNEKKNCKKLAPGGLVFFPQHEMPQEQSQAITEERQLRDNGHDQKRGSH